ncbi:MAG: hypothetical protein RIK87_20775 [Fuerstiella sp.]
MLVPRFSAVLLFLLMLSFSRPAFGLASERIGPDPRTSPQPDWAHGLVELPRHPSRVYSLWVNGNDTFYFATEDEQLSELIHSFSRVRLRDHVVRLKSGEPVVKSFKGEAFRFNVSLNVLGGIALWHSRKTDPKPQTYEPVLTIYVDDARTQEALEQFSWPDNIALENDVPGSELNGMGSVPARKLLHAAVHFQDGKPAVDFENGMSTTITLWEKDHEHGFNLGKVSNSGAFTAALSLEEIRRLKQGEQWLTMTVGNFLAKPAPEHPRLSIEHFSFDPETVQPVTVARSTSYHGRIVYEDGSPPVLEPLPWPGAEIRVSFPYAGMVRTDATGSFSVTFTAEQFEALKRRKPRKNIYIPSYERPNSSRALHTFPAAQLSTDSDSVTAVKIPRPQPQPQ